jgi:phosphate transport system permease protein
LKGTFVAMLFAVPIALAAALYCSEFMHPRFKSVVKPTMEIMASLPSVVLGYIAAQVLATYMEDSFPSIALLIILVPLIIAFFGAWWAKRPMRIRSTIKNGYEWLAIIPIGAIACVVAWQIGLVLDRVLFVYVNAETGDQISSLTSWVSALFSSGEHAKVGQFRLWWSNVMGSSYEQRNSLVVGVIMGFAVIPIIFTIAEDALTNVPKALRSASLALGATRWQTAMRVVLPTASAGIFSALMIGLGRAIGETMIVVMATGNTAIMTMNPFDGMRTLSANIAVELPEAALGGTLYRTLFFGAFLLFLMTFVINTLAEVMRQHLREKYKTV